jgi:hypothetical protein
MQRTEDCAGSNQVKLLAIGQTCTLASFQILQWLGKQILIQRFSRTTTPQKNPISQAMIRQDD